jgi:glycosyltransferase involved in cell wall biosynthesis
VCVGRMAYGKGVQLLAEYPEPVDVYSSAPIASEGSVRYRGATEDVAKTLAQYERFVFLPTVIEPFGRAVVEAWAAGLEIITNRNVGALHWIRNDPEALETAAEDFWAYVTG